MMVWQWQDLHALKRTYHLERLVETQIDITPRRHVVRRGDIARVRQHHVE